MPYPLASVTAFSRFMGAGSSTCSISGTVFDSDGSTAVSGATVALGAFSTVSAANGTYTISNIPVGTSGTLTCTLSGYLWTSISISAMSGNLTGQNFTNTWYYGGGTANKLAYLAIGAASLAASKVNLISPGTNDLTLPGGQSNPSFNSATGWTFDGSTTVLSTGYVPPNQVTRSMALRVANVTVGVGVGRVAASSRNSGVIFRIGINDGANHSVLQNGSNGYTHSTTISSGVLVVAGLVAYLNGAQIGTITAGTYDLSTSVLVVGCLNSSGAFAQFFLGDALAWLVSESTWSSTQVSIISTAMANLA